ncbi:MAG TPA: hypothetical protein VG269_24650 [Tepidisphaeraceae bacterium]|nr:hypothetical protein [Tepidisphaeraceae bacterium]
MNQPNETQLRNTLQLRLDNYRKNLLSCPSAQKLAFELLIQQAERELDALNHGSSAGRAEAPGNLPPPSSPPAAVP